MSIYKMTQVDTVDTALHATRNTKDRGRYWCFTINNPIMSGEELSMTLSVGEYVFQLECGESGTNHYQGFIGFKNARTFASIKKLLPTAHIEKCKNMHAAKAYCSKSDTRIQGPWTNIVTREEIRDPLKDVTLHEWQRNIIKLCDTQPDTRTIHWYHDSVGNSGKTSLAKHLCLTYPEKVLYLCGKAADMKYGVCEFIKKNDLKIVIIDLTRSVENFVSYQGIEEIKNGIFYNTKYESKMVIYNSPHVIVFANFEPELYKLSLDRWNIVDINATHPPHDTNAVGFSS